MLRTGDLNLNQLGDPVKETMKRTIVEHEIVFKSQVRELHRLYWTQKNLMRELYPREVGLGSAKEGHAHVVRAEEVNGKLIDSSDARYKGFNFESPAVDVYNGNSDKNSVDSEIVRPGSSAKGATEERRGGIVPLMEKGNNLYCYEAIDLEEEPNVEAHGISFNGLRIPTHNCGVIGRSGSDIASDVSSSSRVQSEFGYAPYSMRKEYTFLPDLNLLHAGGSESSVASLIDVSTSSTCKQEEPSSSKPMLIDLNKPQDDEASHASSDPMLTFLTPSSSSSVIQNDLWRDQSNRYVKEISDAPYPLSMGKSNDWLFPDRRHDSERSKVSDFGTKQEHEADNKVQESNSTGLTDLCRRSAEGFSSGSYGELPNDANGTALSSVNINVPLEVNENLSSSRLHSAPYSDGRHTSIDMADNMIEDKQAIHERSEDDTVSSHTIARDKNQQDGLTKNYLNECGSQDKIMDENSGTTHLEVESSLKSSCNVEEQHGDCAVIDAAEVLASISLVPPASPPKQLADAVTNEDGSDLPQESSDSFETMTLELPEVSSIVHVTPKMQVDGDAAGEGTSGVSKLRRGRGRAVRDFQKEILPGMASLSRHEICEDMHSIGYELRKNGSRRGGGGGNWVVPIRSRRSRRCP